jgi:exonuclease III
MVVNNNIDPDDHYFYLNEGQCNNYDMHSFKSELRIDDSSIRFFHMNIRSAGRHLDETLLLLDSLSAKFTVIVLTETWLSSEHDWIELPGYTSFHSVRRDKTGGGVTVLVDSTLKCEMYNPLTVNGAYFESCAVTVKFNDRNINVLGVYRPPS